MSANDAFSSAVDIAGLSGIIAGNNAADTVEAGEPGVGVAKTVWFKWTAPDSDVVEINLFDTAFDSVLAVYVGSALGALTEVAMNDEPGIGSYAGPRSYPYPSKVAFVAARGTVYYIQVSAYDGEVGGPFVLRWATGNSQTNDWYSAAAYWAECSYEVAAGGEVLVCKAPTPTAKMTVHTPSNPALLKRDVNPGSSLFVTPGAAHWYFYPPDTGHPPLLDGVFRANALNTSGLFTNGFPYYDIHTVSPPPLASEYLSPGLFSVGGFVRPVFGPTREEQVAFEIEFMVPVGEQLEHYPAPVVASLSGFALSEWTAGTSSGEALHGFVSKDAAYPYSPTDLVLGVHAVVGAGEVRTDTVYVNGAAVRTVTVGDPDFDTALSVRTTVLGSNPGEATIVSFSGSTTGSGASAQTHGVTGGLAGCKYVYQSQFSVTADYTVASQFTMLTQPYWLGPPPAPFWGSLVGCVETPRVVE